MYMLAESGDRLGNCLPDGEMDDDGFYYAELNGKRGLVPSNYIMSVLESKTKNKNI